MNVKTCGFLGCSPTRFRFGWDEEDDLCIMMKNVLMQQIELLYQSGISSFYTVCDAGVGLWAGELLNSLRNNHPDLLLQCITPHEEFATKWTVALRERYFMLLERCTHMTAASKPGDQGALCKAYIQMIDYSDILIAVYAPDCNRISAADVAMAYAAGKNIKLICIHPDSLATSTINPITYFTNER